MALEGHLGSSRSDDVNMMSFFVGYFSMISPASSIPTIPPPTIRIYVFAIDRQFSFIGSKSDENTNPLRLLDLEGVVVESRCAVSSRDDDRVIATRSI